jgi:ceramide glucosyltransferase
MSHLIVRTAQIITAFGAISSSLYYLLCLWGAAAFLRERRTSASAGSRQDLPPISVLKPLKGTDPGIYESFRSHCLQDYPQYELVFGVSDPNDPAVASVQQLQLEFPRSQIRLVDCSERLGANVKVSNLTQMLPVARYEWLIVNDSDIRVDSDYLRRVTAPLTDAKVGLVTCLYRGVPAATLGSRLESLGISTDFCAGVLAARQLEGTRFGLGSTLAFRRTDLGRIGGFESLLDYLADDYELGKRLAALGLSVTLSDEVVATHLPPYDLRGFLSHQLRWARGVRDSRAGGYLGLGLTFGAFWSCLTVAAACGAGWSWALLALTFFLRFAVAVVVGVRVLHDRTVSSSLWLIPMRDLIAFGVWVASFAGHSVMWRGDRFELRNGRLKRPVP